VIIKKHLSFSTTIFLALSLSLHAAQELPTETKSEQATAAPKEKEHVPNSWDKVSALYLPSLIDKAEKQQFLNQLNGTRGYGMPQPMAMQLPKESERLEKALTPNATNYMRQVLAYHANQESAVLNPHHAATAVFDDTTYRDLNVFCGKDDALKVNLFTIIDRTKTIAGRAALLDMVYNPLTDIAALTERQNGIKKLIDDQKLYALVQSKLQTIQDAEKVLFLVLSELNFELITAVTDRFYLKSVFELPIISLITSVPVISLVRLLDHLPFMKSFNEYVCGGLNKQQALLEYHRLESYFNAAVAAPGAFLGLASWCGYHAYQAGLNHEYWQSAKNGAAAISMLIATWFVAKELYKMIGDQCKTENMLHSAMGSLAKMVKALKELQQIVAQHTELTKLVPFKSIGQEAYAAHLELKRLHDLLEDDNFEKPSTWSTPKGKMMAVLKFLCTLKYDLVQPYIDAGTLDALMSSATLYKQQAVHPHARYYFACYEQQSAPHLALNDFWNPFINPDVVVTNSIELGTSTGYHNMLITGPNAGGKSTSLKAMAFAVLLAQTLTITNASIALTPFTKVFTTLNITDTVGKESLYQADKTRIKEVTATLAGLRDDQKALLISDEMFNSTGASYGAALFYGTLNYIDEALKNTLFAAATHFDVLTELEQDTHGSVANFRVEEASLGADGKLSWTYQLKPGVNKQNISFELAREDGFDPKILSAGGKLLKRHAPPVQQPQVVAAA